MTVTAIVLIPSVQRAIMWVNGHLISPTDSDSYWERPNWDGFGFFDKIVPGEIITLSGNDKPDGCCEDKTVIAYKQAVTFFYHGDPLVWMTLQGIKYKGSETKWSVAHVRYRICWPSWCDEFAEYTVGNARSSLAPA